MMTGARVAVEEQIAEASATAAEARLLRLLLLLGAEGRVSELVSERVSE